MSYKINPSHFAVLPALSHNLSDLGPMTSGLSISTIDVGADVSFGERMIASFGAYGASIPMDALAVTGMAAVAQGGVRMKNAVDAYTTAKRRGDVDGQVRSSIDIATRVAQVTTGVAMAGNKIGAGACVLTQTPIAPSGVPLLGAATLYTGYASAVGMTAWCAGMALMGAWDLWGDRQFDAAFSEAASREEALVEFFADHVVATPEELLAPNQMPSGFLVSECWARLREEGMNHPEAVHHLEQRRGRSCVSIDPGNGPVTLYPTERVGLEALRQKKESAKQTAFARRTSMGALRSVKRAFAYGLPHRLQSEDVEIRTHAVRDLETLQGEVKRAHKTTRKVHIAMLTMGLIGTIACAIALGLFTATGVGAVVVGATLMVAALVMLVGDAYAFKESEGVQPGKWDKLYLLLYSAVIVGAMGVIAGTTFGLGLALLPMVVTELTCVGMLGFHALAYKRILHNERKWKEMHPTLEEYVGRIREPGVVHQFKRLPQDVRRTLYKAWMRTRGVLAKDLSDDALLQHALKKAAKELWAQGRINDALKVQKFVDRGDSSMAEDARHALREERAFKVVRKYYAYLQWRKDAEDVTELCTELFPHLSPISA